MTMKPKDIGAHLLLFGIPTEINEHEVKELNILFVLFGVSTNISDHEFKE